VEWSSVVVNQLSQLHLLCDSLVVPLFYHSKAQLGLFLFKGMLLVEYGIDLVLG
jgi:hypothetical protein